MIYGQPSIYKNCDIDKLIRELHGFEKVDSPFSIATGFTEQINNFYINKIIGLAVVELKAYRNTPLTNTFATAFNNDNSYNILSSIGSQYLTPLGSSGQGLSDCIVLGAVDTGPTSLNYQKFIVRSHMGSNTPYGFYASQLYVIGQ